MSGEADAALVGVLAAHQVGAFCGTDTACSCDRKWRTNADHNAHLAAVLAPYVKQRVAEALEGAAVVLQDVDPIEWVLSGQDCGEKAARIVREAKP